MLDCANIMKIHSMYTSICYLPYFILGILTMKQTNIQTYYRALIRAAKLKS